MELVRVENVEMTYRMGLVAVPVLRSVNLTVQRGTFVVIVGPSGSGKSTLINLIGGIDRPTAGRVLFDGHDLSEMSDDQLTEFRREHIGFVFQFYNLVPTLTALENVAIASDIADDPMDPADALELVGLADRATHFPAQLSGGEQQRVAIARAIAKRPTLLLCDEPTGALDLEIGRDVLAVLRGLRERIDATIMLITHNGAIAEMADTVVRIGSGTIESVVHNDAPVPAEEVTW